MEARLSWLAHQWNKTGGLVKRWQQDCTTLEGSANAGWRMDGDIHWGTQRSANHNRRDGDFVYWEKGHLVGKQETERPLK